MRNELGFIQVGSLIPSKRNNITIEAFAKITKDYPDARLTIIGEGPERDKLSRLCETLNIKEKVNFTGFLKHVEVLEEMRKNTYFIMPSAPEGLGIVYLEAMSEGCITIGTRGEGISDIIEDGNNGFLVSIDNVQDIYIKVKKCIEEEQLRVLISQNGKETSDALTWENNAEQYERIYARECKCYR